MQKLTLIFYFRKIIKNKISFIMYKRSEKINHDKKKIHSQFYKNFTNFSSTNFAREFKLYISLSLSKHKPGQQKTSSNIIDFQC